MSSSQRLNQLRKMNRDMMYIIKDYRESLSPLLIYPTAAATHKDLIDLRETTAKTLDDFRKVLDTYLAEDA